MNAIQYAVQEIKTKIPKRILELVFLPRRQYGHRLDPFMPATVDDGIIEKVINDKVRRDVDTGGFEVDIPLTGVRPELIERDKFLLHIPKQLTQGREIVLPLSVIWYSLTNISPYTSVLEGANMSGMTLACSNPISTGAKQMINAYQPQMTVSTANCLLVGSNTVLVESLMVSTQGAYLKCLVSNDSTFSNLPQPAWRAFAKLCVLACKQYIYNYYIIELDEGELVGGQQLGIIKSMIEEYREAGDLYDEYFEDKWRRVQFQADHTRHHRYLKGLIGRYK